MSTATASPAREKFDSLPTTYHGLLGMYQPRVPGTAADAARIADIVATMAGFELTPDQTDFLKLLVMLNGQWRTASGGKRATPVEIVKALMEEHDLDLAGMGKIMGIPKSGVSMILSGDREMSKVSIRNLARRFSLDPGALIGSVDKQAQKSVATRKQISVIEAGATTKAWFEKKSKELARSAQAKAAKKR